jgi:hypothetical protein
MDDDKELGPIPAHIREALASTDDCGDYYAYPRWVLNTRPVPPRSELACMLRADDWRMGASGSLKLINYGPVELALRTLLSRLNWRCWWR